MDNISQLLLHFFQFDANPAVILQSIILIVGVLGSGMSAYVGIKVANTESKKDIQHLTSAVQRLETIVETHINPSTHVSRDQITAIEKAVALMQHSTDLANSRIEAKIDKLMERK